MTSTASIKGPRIKESNSSEGEDSVTETIAERRALHNSVERTRREALNGKFTHLAQQLPSLAHIHRPSKSVIISHCLDMVVDLRETKAENEALRQELHYLKMTLNNVRRASYRSQHNMPVQSDTVTSAGSGFDSMESSHSPRQQQQHQGRGALESASAHDRSTEPVIYSNSISSNQHTLHARLAGSGRASKSGVTPYWPNAADYSIATHMQPAIYHTPQDYGSLQPVPEGGMRSTPDQVGRSSLINGSLYDMEAPPHLFPAEYPPNFELMLQQQQQQQQQQFQQRPAEEANLM